MSQEWCRAAINWNLLIICEFLSLSLTCFNRIDLRILVLSWTLNIRYFYECFNINTFQCRKKITQSKVKATRYFWWIRPFLSWSSESAGNHQKTPSDLPAIVLKYIL